MSEINVDRVLQMEQEYQSAKETAIKALLERQKETGEQLKALGYEAKPGKVSRKRKPCPKCGATDHDARSHRGSDKARNEAARPDARGATA
jgi:ribosomal protein S27AE